MPFQVRRLVNRQGRNPPEGKSEALFKYQKGARGCMLRRKSSISRLCRQFEIAAETAATNPPSRSYYSERKNGYRTVPLEPRPTEKE